MIGFVLDALGVCQHQKTTFPQTEPGRPSPHVSCLECGRRFDYDWQEMRIGSEVKYCATKPIRAIVPECN